MLLIPAFDLVEEYRCLIRDWKRVSEIVGNANICNVDILLSK